LSRALPTSAGSRSTATAPSISWAKPAASTARRSWRDIEQTCRALLLQYADPGEDSVGMEIAVRHLAPTLLGMEVTITVTVVALDGRKIAFEVTAKDALESISTGTHTRFVVDKAKTYERLKAKAAKRDAQGR
jgi:fluoroacetyl-CoA thioesterase